MQSTLATTSPEPTVMSGARDGAAVPGTGNGLQRRSRSGGRLASSPRLLAAMVSVLLLLHNIARTGAASWRIAHATSCRATRSMLSKNHVPHRRTSLPQGSEATTGSLACSMAQPRSAS